MDTIFDDDEIYSTQGTISKSTNAEKENIQPQAALFSSPAKSDGSHKPRRPPTVTPKRFSRFFTPRSSLTGKNERRSKSLRQLRDVTRNSTGRLPEIDAGLPKLEFNTPRPSKRRKTTINVASSPPQSSPIKGNSTTPIKHAAFSILEDDLSTVVSSDEESVDQEPEVLPVQQLRTSTMTNRMLIRSFGGLGINDRRHVNLRPTPSLYDNTANFCSTRNDVAFFSRQQRTLPYCVTACNTNSLVAIGDEQGLIHMFDSAAESDWSKEHLQFRVHTNSVFDIAFSECDYVMASAGGDQTARVVDMQTQSTISVLAGHYATVRQVRFHPNDNKLLTTSSRDGLINIWDLRCAKKPVKLIHHEAEVDMSQLTMYPYASMAAGPAHRAVTAKEKLTRLNATDVLQNQISITSIEHLPGSRSHLLLTASEANASLKLFDLRTAGRNSKSDKPGYEIPVSCTSIPRSQVRNYGVTSLVLSGDGSRAYSICKDSTVWVYSTQHLITGSAPEMVNMNKRTRQALPDKVKQGLAPLYGMRHPGLNISNFYVKASMRKSTTDQPEMLAVGSRNNCAVLFPTDEMALRAHGRWIDGLEGRLLPRSEQATDLIYTNVGTALVRGHTRDVGSVAFAHDGALITAGDDYAARRWQENASLARHLRQGGESEGNRWMCGWADVASSHDDDEEV